MPCSHAKFCPLHRPALTALMTAAVAFSVAGCSIDLPTNTGGNGLWWFLIVALLAVAALAFALGRARAQAAQNQTLLSLRATQQAWRQCLGKDAWQTDAEHRLQWSGCPEQARWVTAPAFLQALQTHLAFEDLLVPALPSELEPAPAAWLLQGQPVLDHHGNFAGFIGIARQQAPDAATLSTTLPGTAGLAKQPQAAAVVTNANEESDAFSFTVSHDLRAPIRVVDGFTRIVKEDYGHLLDRVGNDHLDRVMGAAARMNQMIDAMLSLASLSRQPLARQPVNLSQMAHYVIDDLRRAQPEREVEVFIQDGLQAIGDPTLLRLVLENLLGNAWKYSARTAQAQISLRAVPHGDTVAYVVKDNGAGFDMRVAERLFGLFQRLHSASEFAGHGVGLASVRRIVQRHGGDVWAESEPARGATFSFTLGD